MLILVIIIKSGGFMKIKVYIMHSEKVDYKNNIYKPLLSIGLMNDYFLILPLSEKFKSSYIKQLLIDSDIVICDLSNSNIFLNLEIKMAKKQNKKIYYFINENDKNIKKYNPGSGPRRSRNRDGGNRFRRRDRGGRRGDHDRRHLPDRGGDQNRRQNPLDRLGKHHLRPRLQRSDHGLRTVRTRIGLVCDLRGCGSRSAGGGQRASRPAPVTVRRTGRSPSHGMGMPFSDFDQKIQFIFQKVHCRKG